MGVFAPVLLVYRMARARDKDCDAMTWVLKYVSGLDVKMLLRVLDL
jgi:hypothetical protein